MPEPRQADDPVDPLLLPRYSPRGFTGDAIRVPELVTILEAARWAASSFNGQPWRPFWDRRDAAHWNAALGLPRDFKRSWAERAAALVVIVSRSVRIGADGVTREHGRAVLEAKPLAQPDRPGQAVRLDRMAFRHLGVDSMLGIHPLQRVVDGARGSAFGCRPKHSNPSSRASARTPACPAQRIQH